MKIADFDKFFTAYLECALWSSNDDNDEPLDANYGIDDIDETTKAELAYDCINFLQLVGYYITKSGLGVEYAGHNFWLTRNGHGTGFWDRTGHDYHRELAKVADNFGEVWLYVGDDGMIYSSK